MALSSRQLVELNDALKHRRGQLRDDLLVRLRESGDARLQDIARQVRDLGDESLANAMAEFNLLQMDRLSDDISAVEEALGRITRDEYGYCVNCGIYIPFERLRAEPTAQLCIDCQETREARNPEAPEPTL